MTSHDQWKRDSARFLHLRDSGSRGQKEVHLRQRKRVHDALLQLSPEGKRLRQRYADALHNIRIAKVIIAVLLVSIFAVLSLLAWSVM